MRISQYFLCTTRETPADAEIISHQLMLRAGLIRKVAAGIYTWLPLGLRILRKVETIVREEMQRAGAVEILMPAIQPAELWQESGRWEHYGKELLRIQDRHERHFCFGPTHEEVVTELARREIHSYKQLPLNLFQIQMKFRDEIRPRFGVMRGREFLMKDAYSFDVDKAGMAIAYQKMYEAYTRIFTRLGLNFRAVAADTGSIGGEASHEFQVLAASGEDVIVYSDSSEYAANLELASALQPQITDVACGEPMGLVNTPNQRTINAISAFLQLPVEKTVKTLIVKGADTPLVALILRGDHQLNPLKAQKLSEVADPLTFASEEEILATLHCETGSLGPVNLPIPVIVDESAAVITDFCCGANITDKHYLHVNWGRDVPLTKTADLRFVVEGDASPDGQGQLKFARGIEVGHIFQLGDKYSHSLQATVTAPQGKKIEMQMGCYGIGVSRILGAAIEQNHDERGIIWPEAMAPFKVIIIPVNAKKSALVQQTCEKLYADLMAANIEVLLDDRDERLGVMLADAELIGIPHRLVISERTLADHQVEYQPRRATESQRMGLAEIIPFFSASLS